MSDGRGCNSLPCLSLPLPHLPHPPHPRHLPTLAALASCEMWGFSMSHFLPPHRGGTSRSTGTPSSTEACYRPISGRGYSHIQTPRTRASSSMPPMRSARFRVRERGGGRGGRKGEGWRECYRGGGASSRCAQADSEQEQSEPMEACCYAGVATSHDVSYRKPNPKPRTR